MPGFKQSAPDHGLRFAARPRSWFGTPGLRAGLRWIATTFAMAGSLRRLFGDGTDTSPGVRSRPRA